MFSKLPLAWLQLVRNRARFLVALLGVGFIVVLLFMQIGFHDALYSSATQVHRSLRGDLFMLSKQYQSLTSNQSFPRARLYQSLGFEGVENVAPVYLQFAKLKNPENFQKFPIYIMGFNPGNPVSNLPEVNQKLDVLKRPNVVLFDRQSREEFGPIADQIESGDIDLRIELFTYTDEIGYRVKFGGLFDIGPSFGVDGNLISSDSTFSRMLSRDSGIIDIGLIDLKPGADPQTVAKNLNSRLPPDVQIFTREEVLQLEKIYWSVRTPIGFILNLMLSMAFVIGVAVVYQILYSNISNHLISFATLKAIGYSDRYLFSLVFRQALIISFLGFLPGFFISYFLYDLATHSTKLPMYVDLDKSVLILSVTLAMCMFSGFAAAGKLRSADPADIF